MQFSAERSAVAPATADTQDKVFSEVTPLTHILQEPTTSNSAATAPSDDLPRSTTPIRRTGIDVSVNDANSGHETGAPEQPASPAASLPSQPSSPWASRPISPSPFQPISPSVSQNSSQSASQVSNTPNNTINNGTRDEASNDATNNNNGTSNNASNDGINNGTSSKGTSARTSLSQTEPIMQVLKNLPPVDPNWPDEMQANYTAVQYYSSALPYTYFQCIFQWLALEKLCYGKVQCSFLLRSSRYLVL
jgi:hypothetical protein